MLTNIQDNNECIYDSNSRQGVTCFPVFPVSRRCLIACNLLSIRCRFNPIAQCYEARNQAPSYVVCIQIHFKPPPLCQPKHPVFWVISIVSADRGGVHIQEYWELQNQACHGKDIPIQNVLNTETVSEVRCVLVGMWHGLSVLDSYVVSDNTTKRA